MTIIRALALATLLASALPAQTPPTTPVSQTKEAEPDLAVLRSMKSKVFEVKHRSPLWLCNSLYPLQSGVRGRMLNWTDSDGLKLISVRDFPENLAAIEEALKRLDVPSSAQKTSDVELTLHVLFAAKAPAPEAGLPTDLQEVVRQLKNTLTYRGYTLAASFVQRVAVNGDRAINGRGQLEGNALESGETKGSPLLFVDWECNRIASLEAEGAGRYSLRKFYFLLRERRGAENLELARMESDINLKEGEKVVVGTTVVKDRGLIVVLSARRVN